MLADDKARSEHEARLRLDKGCDDVNEARRALDELKFLVGEKTKLGCTLMDELGRAKRCLDEKCCQVHRLKDESAAKGDQVSDDRSRLAILHQEIESVKAQRAEMWREINRLKDVIEKKSNEGQIQCERNSTLNHEIARVQSRNDDLTKMIECRTHDLCAKQRNVDDTDRELMRNRDCNNKLSQDCAMLRRDNDRLQMENSEAAKELKCTEARNSEFASQARDSEIKLKGLEQDLFATKRDIECLRQVSC